VFDLIIAGGTVVDGTRDARPRRTDLGVKDGTIAAVDDLGEARSATRIDATGKVVAPGFIDVHVHSEAQLLGKQDDLYASSLQGVTTHLTAPDGFGWGGLSADLARSMWDQTVSIYGVPDGFEVGWRSPEAYRTALAGDLPVNVVLQVPHHAVRATAMGFDRHHAQDPERRAMTGSVEAWLQAGAVSLALGLDYIPGGFSDEGELVHLAQILADTGGSLQSHARFTELGRDGAWEEMLRVGRATGIRVNISHATLDDELVDLIEPWLDQVDLALDTYLYPAGCTHLLYLIPTVHQVETASFLESLTNPDGRAAALAHFEHAFATGSDPTRMTIGASRSGRHDGTTIAEVADASGRNATEAALTLVEEEEADVLIVYGQATTDEAFAANVAATLAFPNAMIASDGIYRGRRPHPRGFGCFPRVLREYVRERGLVSLEDAIYRMSGLPAERYGLDDRGRLEAGRIADVVILDPDTVGDRATWEQPRLPPVGIDHVIVNGHEVIRDAAPTGKLPGRVR